MRTLALAAAFFVQTCRGQGQQGNSHFQGQVQCPPCILNSDGTYTGRDGFDCDAEENRVTTVTGSSTDSGLFDYENPSLSSPQSFANSFGAPALFGLYLESNYYVTISTCNPGTSGFGGPVSTTGDSKLYFLSSCFQGAADNYGSYGANFRGSSVTRRTCQDSEVTGGETAGDTAGHTLEDKLLGAGDHAIQILGMKNGEVDGVRPPSTFELTISCAAVPVDSSCAATTAASEEEATACGAVTALDDDTACANAPNCAYTAAVDCASSCAATDDASEEEATACGAVTALDDDTACADTPNCAYTAAADLAAWQPDQPDSGRLSEECGNCLGIETPESGTNGDCPVDGNLDAGAGCSQTCNDGFWISTPGDADSRLQPSCGDDGRFAGGLTSVTCDACTTCPTEDGKQYVAACTATSDAICSCISGYWGDGTTCTPCTPVDSLGEGATLTCTTAGDATIVPSSGDGLKCIPGTFFTDTTGAADTCTDCNMCSQDGEDRLDECTPVKDTVCGCQAGWWGNPMNGAGSVNGQCRLCPALVNLHPLHHVKCSNTDGSDGRIFTFIDANVTLNGDLASYPDGSTVKNNMIISFKDDVAARLTSAGLGGDSPPTHEDVWVTSLAAGSIVVEFSVLVPLATTDFSTVGAAFDAAFTDQAIAGGNGPGLDVVDLGYPDDIASLVPDACNNGWFIETINTTADRCSVCIEVANATDATCTRLGDTTVITCQPGYAAARRPTPDALRQTVDGECVEGSGGEEDCSMDSCPETLCMNDEYVSGHTCVPCCEDMAGCNATNYYGDPAGQDDTRCLLKCDMVPPANAELGDCPAVQITGRTCTPLCKQGFSVETVKRRDYLQPSHPLYLDSCSGDDCKMDKDLWLPQIPVCNDGVVTMDFTCAENANMIVIGIAVSILLIIPIVIAVVFFVKSFALYNKNKKVFMWTAKGACLHGNAAPVTALFCGLPFVALCLLSLRVPPWGCTCACLRVCPCPFVQSGCSLLFVVCVLSDDNGGRCSS